MRERERKIKRRDGQISNSVRAEWKPIIATLMSSVSSQVEAIQRVRQQQALELISLAAHTFNCLRTYAYVYACITLVPRHWSFATVIEWRLAVAVIPSLRRLWSPCERAPPQFQRDGGKRSSAIDLRQAVHPHRPTVYKAPQQSSLASRFIPRATENLTSPSPADPEPEIVADLTRYVWDTVTDLSVDCK